MDNRGAQHSIRSPEVGSSDSSNSQTQSLSRDSDNTNPSFGGALSEQAETRSEQNPVVILAPDSQDAVMGDTNKSNKESSESERAKLSKKQKGDPANIKGKKKKEKKEKELNHLK